MAMSQDGVVARTRLILKKKIFSCQERRYRHDSSRVLSSWSLNLISLESEGSLMKAEVSWPDPGTVLGEVPARFLVRWGLTQGAGIMDSIKTNSTAATISMYKDSHCSK